VYPGQHSKQCQQWFDHDSIQGINSSDIAESWQYRGAGCHSNKYLLLTEIQDADFGKTRKILTPLTLPGRTNSVARWVISVPSTTGTKKQVPKDPLFDTFTLTLLTVGASTWPRHSRASRAVKHLLQTASALVTKIPKRCTLLDEHPQRLASASSEWGVSEISDQMYYLRNSMTEIVLRGLAAQKSEIVFATTCWMQHLGIEIRQGDAITVTRTRRLSPNCHLLGISTELAGLMIQMLVKEGR